MPILFKSIVNNPANTSQLVWQSAWVFWGLYKSLYCKFAAVCDSERIWKIGQFLNEVMKISCWLAFWHHPVGYPRVHVWHHRPGSPLSAAHYYRLASNKLIPFCNRSNSACNSSLLHGSSMAGYHSLQSNAFYPYWAETKLTRWRSHSSALFLSAWRNVFQLMHVFPVYFHIPLPLALVDSRDHRHRPEPYRLYI